MDFFKNTLFITILCIVLAAVVMALGYWRENLYRELDDKQKKETEKQQAKISEQQLEMIRLIYKIQELQNKKADATSKDINQIKRVVEDMRSQAIISDSTAKDVIVQLEGISAKAELNNVTAQ